MKDANGKALVSGEELRKKVLEQEEREVARAANREAEQAAIINKYGSIKLYEKCESYSKEFSDDIVTSYRRNELMTGMTKHMVIEMYGEPNDIKREAKGKNITEDLF
jgi:hypothetical protein